MSETQSRLFEMKDEKYKEFQSRLMPTVDPQRIIGVRMPDIRRLAKEMLKDGSSAAFLCELPHYYYDENNLHGSIISSFRDLDTALFEVERFLSYIDNWATCDTTHPAAFKKSPAKLLERTMHWLESPLTYTVRYGIDTLMDYYLEDSFTRESMAAVAAIRSDEYYIKMAAAWYFATALAKQPDAAMSVIKSRELDKWTHNKSIQKAIESYRISDEMKTELRSMKVK